MLNLTVVSEAVPLWVFAVQAGPGSSCRSWPRRCPSRAPRGARCAPRSMITACASAGRAGCRLGCPFRCATCCASPGAWRSRWRSWPQAGRCSSRRCPSRAWERNLDKIYEARRYDVEIRFLQPRGPTSLRALRPCPGCARGRALGLRAGGALGAGAHRRRAHLSRPGPRWLVGAGASGRHAPGHAANLGGPMAARGRHRRRGAQPHGGGAAARSPARPRDRALDRLGRRRRLAGR